MTRFTQLVIKSVDDVLPQKVDDEKVLQKVEKS